MAALRELPPAVSTRIRTLSRVDAPVLHQQLTPGKAFPAVLTPVALPDSRPLRTLVQQACNPAPQISSHV
jgi:hypothetical protein